MESIDDFSSKIKNFDNSPKTHGGSLVLSTNRLKLSPGVEGSEVDDGIRRRKTTGNRWETGTGWSTDYVKRK